MKTEEITKEIADFLIRSPLNKVNELGLDRIFDDPLVGVAGADDSLFAKFKEPDVVGPHHLLPAEWLPEAQSVISYFLPFSQAVREANYSPGLPATEWLYGRIEGESFNKELRKHLVEFISGRGGKALAPALDSRYAVQKKRSNWSERHAAFAAGLGTFGLSKSLITSKGSAGRYGSVIISLKLEATTRAYEQTYAFCSSCLQCIERCPSDAISKDGKDIWICSKYSDTEIKPRFRPRYGCGKCQTNVPCEDGFPV